MAKGLHKWMTKRGPRYLLDEKHQKDVEGKAANYEFIDRMSQSDAEDKAYGEYRHSQHRAAAKKHWRAKNAAQSSGDTDAEKRHSLLYEMHLKAAGGDPRGVAPSWLDEDGPEGREAVVSFKAHPADGYLLEKFDNGMTYGEALVKGEVVAAFPNEHAALERALADRHPVVTKMYRMYGVSDPHTLQAMKDAIGKGQMHDHEYAPGVKLSHILGHHIESKTIKKGAFYDTAAVMGEAPHPANQNTNEYRAQLLREHQAKLDAMGKGNVNDSAEAAANAMFDLQQAGPAVPAPRTSAALADQRLIAGAPKHHIDPEGQLDLFKQPRKCEFCGSDQVVKHWRWDNLYDIEREAKHRRENGRPIYLNHDIDDGDRLTCLDCKRQTKLEEAPPPKEQKRPVPRLEAKSVESEPAVKSLKDLPIWAQTRLFKMAVNNLAAKAQTVKLPSIRKADDDVPMPSVQRQQEYEAHYKKLREIGMDHRAAHKAAKSIAYAGVPSDERQKFSNPFSNLKPGQEAPVDETEEAIAAPSEAAPEADEEWFDDDGNWIKDEDMPATTADAKMKAAGVSYKTKGGKWMPNKPKKDERATLPDEDETPMDDGDKAWEAHIQRQLAAQRYVPPEPNNFNDLADLQRLYGADRVPHDFDPTNAKHWGGLMGKLTPVERIQMANQLFSHDRWVAQHKPGVGPATGPKVRSGEFQAAIHPPPEPEVDEGPMSDSEWDRADKVLSDMESNRSKSLGINAPFKDITTKAQMDPHRVRRVVKNMKKSLRDELSSMLKTDFVKYVVASAWEESLQKYDRYEEGGPHFASGERHTPAYAKPIEKGMLGAMSNAGIQGSTKGGATNAPIPSIPKLPGTVKKTDVPAGKTGKYPFAIMYTNDNGKTYNHLETVHANDWEHAYQVAGIKNQRHFAAVQLDENGKMTFKAEKKMNVDPNKIKTRDEGIRRQKLPPGAPGADKAGVGVQTDRRKQKNKEAARKWKHGKDD